MSLLTTLLITDAVTKYSPDQERDERGRFGASGLSDKANEASSRANGTGKVGDHNSAAKAHQAAASAHRTLAADTNRSKEERQQHGDAYRAHLSAANRHEGLAARGGGYQTAAEQNQIARNFARERMRGLK